MKHYRYQALPSEFYLKNREVFSEKMQPNSLAIFHSLDRYPLSADSTMPFIQSTDFLHLTGIDQEASVLLIYKSEAQTTSYLFLTETNEHIKVWEGEKFSKNDAKSLSGIEEVYWLDQYETILDESMVKVKTVYTHSNEHRRAQKVVPTKNDRETEKLRNKYPTKKFFNAYEIMTGLRVQKQKPEIEALQKACDITKGGFDKVLEALRPGRIEYEIEAIWAQHFIAHGAQFAYEPIIASGVNNCVLHYTKNTETIQKGDLVLMDVGASYANYSADLTRTIPANGRFSTRQKAVYNAVLNIKNEAAKMLVSGNVFAFYKKEVIKLVNSALVDLGLISSAEKVEKEHPKAAFKKYFMHGISHHLGLDTHDYGETKGKIKSGMVLTVEPGIYIPEEGFGIRLEDDYVVQSSTGPTNLMSHIAIEVDEIEDLMN